MSKAMHNLDYVTSYCQISEKNTLKGVFHDVVLGISIDINNINTFISHLEIMSK